MKIVHVVTSTGIGGAQMMLLRYLQSLGDRVSDHHVVSLLPGGQIGSRIAELGVPLIELPLGTDSGPGRPVLALGRELRRLQPDVVHAWMYHACLVAWGARLMLPRPAPKLVWGIHHSLQDIAREKPRSRLVIRTMARLSRYVDVITYCSEMSREQHERIGFAAERSVFIPNATDEQRFRPDEGAKTRLAALCGIPESRIILGTAARSHPMKDHPSMVRATALLVDRGHDVQAVLVGEGHEGSAAQRLAVELGIADRVSLLPATDAIESVVAGFDIFMLTSAWGEAFSIALTEAMAAEVPAVVTDVGDSARIVEGCGVSVPPERPDLLADAVAGLIDRGENGRRALGRAARKRVIENYTLGEYARRHLDVYLAGVASA